MLSVPTIVVNVKTYVEATGEAAVELTKIMDQLASETDSSLGIAVQATDIYRCAQHSSIPIFSEHIDPISPGSHTGWTLPGAVQEAGAVGTLINHSEHRLKLADIERCITLASEHGLEAIVCTNNVATSRAAATLGPRFVAVEPPKLIGGDVSVTSANPDIVSESVQVVKEIDTNVKVLCGAGVKNGKDVAKAIELGADGVLLASGVVKASDTRAVLQDLIAGLK